MQQVSLHAGRMCIKRNECLGDATLWFTGAGPRGGINGFAARNLLLSAIALSLRSGTARTDWQTSPDHGLGVPSKRAAQDSG